MKTMDLTELTATQQKIMKALSDGETHTKDELKKLLPDDLAGKKALGFHICMIRRYLRPRGHDVVFINGGVKDGYGYRHVRRISMD